MDAASVKGDGVISRRFACLSSKKKPNYIITSLLQSKTPRRWMISICQSAIISLFCSPSNESHKGFKETYSPLNVFPPQDGTKPHPEPTQALPKVQK